MAAVERFHCISFSYFDSLEAKYKSELTLRGRVVPIVLKSTRGEGVTNQHIERTHSIGSLAQE